MIIDAGDDFIILNFSLTTSAQNITTTRPIRGAYLQGRGESDIVIRRVGTDSTTFLLKGGNGLRLNLNRIPDSGTTYTICDARPKAGTETLEVLLTL